MPARRVAILFVAVIALFFTGATLAAAQPGPRSVSGEVMDSSGGLLPGVTITARSSNGQLLATTVSDEIGGYAFGVLPPGTITLTFELGGFAPSTVTLALRPGGESRAVQRLELAPFSARVDVEGRTPRAAPVTPAPPVRPRPIVEPVPVYDRDTFCGPAKPLPTRESLGTIAGSREANQALYAEGAELLVDGGLNNGLERGRNLIARRHDRIAGESAATALREHSAGLVQIVEANEESSIAVVVFACDEIRQGDFLAAFTPPSAPNFDPPGTPDFRNAARILFADEGQRLGAPRRLMVIDHGTEHGTYVGQRFTLFRERIGRGGRDAVGSATVVSVRSDSATIRVDRIMDAITAGDWAAPDVPPLSRLADYPHP